MNSAGLITSHASSPTARSRPPLSRGLRPHTSTWTRQRTSFCAKRTRHTDVRCGKPGARSGHTMVRISDLPVRDERRRQKRQQRRAGPPALPITHRTVVSCEADQRRGERARRAASSRARPKPAQPPVFVRRQPTTTRGLAGGPSERAWARERPPQPAPHHTEPHREHPRPAEKVPPSLAATPRSNQRDRKSIKKGRRTHRRGPYRCSLPGLAEFGRCGCTAAGGATGIRTLVRG